MRDLLRKERDRSREKCVTLSLPLAFNHFVVMGDHGPANMPLKNSAKRPQQDKTRYWWQRVLEIVLHVAAEVVELLARQIDRRQLRSQHLLSDTRNVTKRRISCCLAWNSSTVSISTWRGWLSSTEGGKVKQIRTKQKRKRKKPCRHRQYILQRTRHGANSFGAPVSDREERQTPGMLFRVCLM